jgi:hypothetical protein
MNQTEQERRIHEEQKQALIDASNRCGELEERLVSVQANSDADMRKQDNLITTLKDSLKASQDDAQKAWQRVEHIKKGWRKDDIKLEKKKKQCRKLLKLIKRMSKGL